MQLRSVAKRWLAMIFLLVLSVQSRAQTTWEWKTETVDAAGQYTAIVADRFGDLHLTYSGGASGVRYGYRPAHGKRWFVMKIGQGEEYTNLTVDTNGFPHLCYNAYGKLYYVSFDGKAWHTEPIAPDSGRIMFTCSVAVAADGTPHVIWYQVGSGGTDFYHIRHAVREKGVWKVRTVDHGREVGKWNSLVIDSGGLPHMTYSCWRERQLRYTYWDGKEWIPSTVDNTSGRTVVFPAGLGSSLILGPKGPLISYEDENTVRYAHREGSRWVNEIVDEITVQRGWLDYRTRMVLDKEGNPHIVYQDAGQLKHAFRNDKGQWDLQVLAPAGVSPYFYASITIDPEGTLYVSYSDAADESIRVATGRRVPVAPVAADVKTNGTKDNK